jgi:Lon protease-like protein
LPLRIFEVRYLDMIGKCHKAGAPFGVVSLTEGSEVRRPADAGQRPHGRRLCERSLQRRGHPGHHHRVFHPQPGLMVIRCTGAQRFEISRREKLKHGLWIADVTRLEDDQTVAIPPDLQGTPTRWAS